MHTDKLGKSYKALLANGSVPTKAAAYTVDGEAEMVSTSRIYSISNSWQ